MELLIKTLILDDHGRSGREEWQRREWTCSLPYWFRSRRQVVEKIPTPAPSSVSQITSTRPAHSMWLMPCC